ncbi:MAG TPA: hypothetical protein VG603_09130, partial [Chitinophagales bacterium]|nr:hypothetical protein [Chitinophagales bacterium]
EEAIKNYYRFFQSWAYLRYDVKTPQFLKVFFNSFTEYGFEQHYNPFYYRPDTYRKTTRYAEAEELYTLLIKKFSEQCKRTIVIANDSTIEGILNRGNFANIEMLKPVITNVAKQNKAVYRMPRYHYSGTGAFLLAKELSSLITHTPDTLSYTTMQEAETDSMALPTNEPLLTNYDSICFTANGQLMGLLFKNPHPEQNIAFIIKADLKKDNINTLLLTTSNYHDLIFIPLAKRPADNTNVQIETDGDSNKNFSIGTIHYINPFVCEIIPPEKNQMLNRQVNYIGETQSGWLVAAKSKKIGRASLNIDGNFIALSVSDTTLNNTRGNTNYILTMPALYAIRSAPDACFVAADTSRKVGYYLVAHKNGIAQNFPFAQLSVEHKIVRH